MDTSEENGGPFDMSDDKDGEKAIKSCFSMKERSVPRLLGVVAAPEAGKVHIYLTGIGRNVHKDAAVQPPSQGGERIWGLTQKCLPAQFTRGCVISRVCGDLNGFTESFGDEEATVVSLDGGVAGGLPGRGAAAFPAVIRGPVSPETHTEEPPGSAMKTAPEESANRVSSVHCRCTSAPPGRQTCALEKQQSYGRVSAALSCPDVNKLNGASVLAHNKPTGLFSNPVPDHSLALVEAALVHRGFHPSIANCYCSVQNDTGVGPVDRTEWGSYVTKQSGTMVCQCSLTKWSDSKDAPRHSTAAPEESRDRPASEPSFRENQVDLYPRSFPLRPNSLRTNPNLTVSLSCDATPLSPDEENGFYFGEEGYSEDFRNVLETGRRRSAPDQLPDLSGVAGCSDIQVMPKRFDITDFFTRSLFSRKSKESKLSPHNATGWRLFGRTAAIDVHPHKDSASMPSTKHQCPQDEEDQVMGKDVGVSSCPTVILTAAGRRRNLEFEPLSTTALILEDRPANLPAKSVEETLRHKMEYEEMVAGAKRREMKEAQRKKRQMKERHRREDSISNAMVIWNTEILPHWDVMKGTRRVRELWWQGLPPSVRGRVWSLAIGNELNITAELYEIFLSRAKEKWRSYSETSSVNDSEKEAVSAADRESSLDLIKLDISRTFPSLFIFQKGGPYHDLLHSVLGAYTCYRPDIGYVQGMSFIAAVLILNLEEAEAFITFANLLNKPCQMVFFRVDHEMMLKYFEAFEVFFQENLPQLFSHFQSNNLTPDLYLIDWIFTLYSKSLPLDVACRVWDVFCRDGEESLFRTALGILRLFEDVLLQMDFIHIAQFLSRLPDDLQSHTLFTAMANTQMLSKNRRWVQVFSTLMKNGNKEMEKNVSPSSRTLTLADSRC
eukprot:XP_011601305.1 PREDICTED: TBC1 domain family member 12-like isoform X1 [Takifugu rubripes]